MSSNIRQNKGNNIYADLSDYTVIDVETTGFIPDYCDIIEYGALRVREGQVVAEFQQLCNPGYEIDSFITAKTGITSEMLKGMPSPETVIDQFLTFLGNDVLVGHNTNFDINFLYDVSDGRLPNDFIDTMRYARHYLRNLERHRLIDLVNHFGFDSSNMHRSIPDCYLTKQVYESLLPFLREFGPYKKTYRSEKTDFSLLEAEGETDPGHPLFGKVCVFTGTLEKMIRREAAQLVVNCGGTCENSVTKRTNFLILGNNDYCKSIKDGKSNKHKKAESLSLAGQDIEIIPESVFYDLVEDNQVPRKRRKYCSYGTI